VIAPATTWGRRVLAAAGLALALLPGARADDAKKKQEILWEDPPIHSVTDGPFMLSAKATSKLKVSFELVSGPADYDGKWIKLSGQAGLVIVRASQDGNDHFEAAPPVERVIRVEAKPAAPVVVGQPVPAMVSIGDLVMLSVQVEGEPLPVLQWRKDGINLPGATERTLTLSSAAAGDAGNYDLLATNPLGTTRSAVARVSIGKRRQSIQFQASGNAMAGQPVMLNASASSGLPVRFTVLSGMAAVSGGMVTSQGGTVVVEAEQPGDSTYEAALPVTQTFQFQTGSAGQAHTY
jgi:Immunoglobulin I-set domain